MAAVPLLTEIEHCADFAQTVQPYIPQLLKLPQKVIDAASSNDAFFELYRLYLHTNPLISGFALSMVLSAFVFVVSEINRNYSQVDRLWSIVPAIYVGHFSAWARLSGIATPRVNLAWAFTLIWSTRLTFNYWRRGGYSVGSEDYRWPIVREKLHPVVAFLFNAVFISVIQNVLLYSLVAPAYSMMLSSQFEEKVMAGDLFFYGTQLLLIITEGFADQQQWDFQTAKAEYQKTAKVPKGFTQAELDRGFLVSGLWAYSRHPNFACEQMIWFCLYQWNCYTSKVVYSWTGLGSLSLIFLFQGSTWLTELLSAGKYPEYSEYQRQVAMFLPMWFGGYKTPGPAKPKVIRTSELEKKAAEIAARREVERGNVHRRAA